LCAVISYAGTKAGVSSLQDIAVIGTIIVVVILAGKS
jgi:hypothetical protein